MGLFRRVVVCLLACVLALPTFAGGLQSPTGRVLLTVSGEIGTHNSNDAVKFDRQMLETLDWREIETFTSFTTGPQRFSGPTLASVLEAVEAGGSELRLTAINDYSSQIPLTDASAHDVLLALDHNGNPMRIRDKGPIWVVYPLDEAQASRQLFDNQMVWQLDRIVVVE